jgi:FkbM family methyltransferase
VLSFLRRITYRDARYEAEYQAAISRVVEHGSTCADVGAHEGIYTRLLARLVGESGRVFAFEAHPENAGRLRRSLGRALEQRVIVENLAVTDGATELVMLHPGRNRRSEEWNVTGVDLDGRSTPAELEVGATSLDAYFEDRQLDFVKLDVEGAEALVLRGMRRTLREARPVVAVEFHTDEGWAGRKELLEAGYRLETPEGEAVDTGADATRVYLCLARPT